LKCKKRGSIENSEEISRKVKDQKNANVHSALLAGLRVRPSIGKKKKEEKTGGGSSIKTMSGNYRRKSAFELARPKRFVSGGVRGGGEGKDCLDKPTSGQKTANPDEKGS